LARRPDLKPVPPPQSADRFRDPRHNPDRALELIKEAHRVGGRPADANHFEDARSGWVQKLKFDEEIVTRNGKVGYRKFGVKNGPLRTTSTLERDIQQQEATFLKRLARYQSLDDAVLRLASHRQKACHLAVVERSVRAHQVEVLVINLYLTSKLPLQHRISSAARLLKREGFVLTIRRIRQIVQDNVPRIEKKRK